MQMNLTYSRKIQLLSLIIILIIGLIGCESLNNSSPDENEDFIDAEGVLLRGNFSENDSQVQTAAQETEKVGKVILVYPTGYEMYEVVDGEFAIDMKKEKPAGIAFLNSSDEYLGFLTLEDGMNTIPPQFINEETEVIDFGTITFEGKKASPEKNPVGEDKKIDINKSKKSMLATSNSLFAAGLKSPDVIELLTKENIHWFELIVDYVYEEFKYVEKDDNNEIDYENTFEETHPEYNIEYPFFKSHRFRVRVKDIENHGDDIKLNYPENGEVSCPDGPNDDSYYEFEGITSEKMKELTGEYSSYPPGGDYRVDFNENLKINFSLPGNFQDLVTENTFLIVPTLHLKEEGEALLIDKITWKYITYNGEEITSEKASDIIMEERDFGLYLNIKDSKDREESIDPESNSYEFEEDIAWSQPDNNYPELESMGTVFEDFYGIYYEAEYVNEKLKTSQ